MVHMTKHLATAVLLLGFLCVDLVCGLVLSGPPLASSPPPSATTYSADSTLFRSHSSPSSLQHGVATWLASREPNQRVRPFVPTSVQTAQRDTSQDAETDWKEQVESFAGVATVVSAAATVFSGGATVFGLLMATRWMDRDQKRFEWDQRRFEREEREADNSEIISFKESIRGLKRDQIQRTSTIWTINLLMLYFLPSDSHFGMWCDYLVQMIHPLKPITASRR